MIFYEFTHDRHAAYLQIADAFQAYRNTRCAYNRLIANMPETTKISSPKADKNPVNITIKFLGVFTDMSKTRSIKKVLPWHWIVELGSPL